MVNRMTIAAPRIEIGPVAPVHLRKLEAFAFREDVRTPVALSFGIMRQRSAVFVRLEDADGAFGWGEIFANWPAAGAEHRCRLVVEDIADIFLGNSFAHPSDLFHLLEARTEIRALQCGEWGPFRQAIAGLDIALWDLFARRAGQPLASFLNPQSPAHVPAYASGIHPDAAPAEIEKARAQGFAQFKVKTGFGRPDEAGRIAELAGGLQTGERLCVDANQGWDEVQAAAFLRETEALNLAWVEEPIIATAPEARWQRLSRVSATPLAGGENIAGHPDFERAQAAGYLSVLQPDVAKWGGITGCHGVARRAIGAGRSYCPHYLGGGIGLAASAHLLAAAGGPGLLEVDVNPNRLRQAFGDLPGAMSPRGWDIRAEPGLGIEALPEELDRYRTCHSQSAA